MRTTNTEEEKSKEEETGREGQNKEGWVDTTTSNNISIRRPGRTGRTETREETGTPVTMNIDPLKQYKALKTRSLL